uniref:EamA domain-containing protein n=1 Tax=viral metagenome TaxID=1070528 RepID=A0A6C0ER87_9ZZZZ
MYLAIISKLLGESLLSFYSIFVKKINVELIMQMWSRFFTYVIISAFFVDWGFIAKSIFSMNGILLSAVTGLHVYSSYRSFQLLDSGVATTLFYVYPILILLFSGTAISPVFLISLFGVYLIANDLRGKSNESKEKTEKNENPENIIKTNTEMKPAFWNEGIFAAFMAAITEAMIFFLVKDLKTLNNWNHLFLSYLFGAIVLTGYLWKNIASIQLYSGASISLAVNAFIGLVGYYLRFFAISRLDASIYAPLSYFGIVMSYIYGIFLNNDKITIQKIIGTLCIVFTNLYILYSGVHK